MKDWDNFGYLGDGVYAYWDGYGISIRVNNHEAPESVYIEPQVLEALNRFYTYQTKRT